MGSFCLAKGRELLLNGKELGRWGAAAESGSKLILRACCFGLNRRLRFGQEGSQQGDCCDRRAERSRTVQRMCGSMAIASAYVGRTLAVLRSVAVMGNCAQRHQSAEKKKQDRSRTETGSRQGGHVINDYKPFPRCFSLS